MEGEPRTVLEARLALERARAVELRRALGVARAERDMWKRVAKGWEHAARKALRLLRLSVAVSGG